MMLDRRELQIHQMCGEKEMRDRTIAGAAGLQKEWSTRRGIRVTSSLVTERPKGQVQCQTNLKRVEKA